MGSLKEHEEDCEQKLGKPWTKVHLWLDQYAESMGLSNHRDMLHHDAGIEEARKKFGDEGAAAARLHILMDYGGRIPTYKEAWERKLYGQAD